MASTPRVSAAPTRNPPEFDLNYSEHLTPSQMHQLNNIENLVESIRQTSATNLQRNSSAPIPEETENESRPGSPEGPASVPRSRRTGNTEDAIRTVVSRLEQIRDEVNGMQEQLVNRNNSDAATPPDTTTERPVRAGVIAEPENDEEDPDMRIYPQVQGPRNEYAIWETRHVLSTQQAQAVSRLSRLTRVYANSLQDIIFKHGLQKLAKEYVPENMFEKVAPKLTNKTPKEKWLNIRRMYPRAPTRLQVQIRNAIADAELQIYLSHCTTLAKKQFFLNKYIELKNDSLAPVKEKARELAELVPELDQNNRLVTYAEDKFWEDKRTGRTHTIHKAGEVKSAVSHLNKMSDQQDNQVRN